MKKGRFGRGAALWELIVLLGGGLALAAADGRAPELKIAVSPSVALYGAPFSLKVTGLRPSVGAAIKAVSTDARKILWESMAVFEADAAGAQTPSPQDLASFLDKAAQKIKSYDF